MMRVHLTLILRTRSQKHTRLNMCRDGKRRTRRAIRGAHSNVVRCVHGAKEQSCACTCCEVFVSIDIELRIHMVYHTIHSFRRVTRVRTCAYVKHTHRQAHIDYYYILSSGVDLSRGNSARFWRRPIVETDREHRSRNLTRRKANTHADIHHRCEWYTALCLRIVHSYMLCVVFECVCWVCVAGVVVVGYIRRLHSIWRFVIVIEFVAQQVARFDKRLPQPPANSATTVWTIVQCPDQWYNDDDMCTVHISLWRFVKAITANRMRQEIWVIDTVWCTFSWRIAKFSLDNRMLICGSGWQFCDWREMRWFAKRDLVPFVCFFFARSWRLWSVFIRPNCVTHLFVRNVRNIRDGMHVDGIVSIGDNRIIPCTFVRVIRCDAMIRRNRE